MEAAVAQAPTDNSIRVELGQMLMRLQRPTQAIEVLQEAVRRAPTDTSVRADLVRAYLNSHDFNSARAAAADLRLTDP